MNRPVVVVFGWAAFNGLLTAILVIYSYVDPFPLIVYMSAVLLVGGYGTAVLVAARRRASDGWVRIAARSASMAFLAIGITLIGLGFVYGLWLMPVALYPLLLAGILARRERLPSAVVPYGRFDPVTGRAEPRVVTVDLPDPSAAEAPAEPHRPTGRPAVVAVAAGLALAAKAVLGARRRQPGDR
jgi:hypothetical protein